MVYCFCHPFYIFINMSQFFNEMMISCQCVTHAEGLKYATYCLFLCQFGFVTGFCMCRHLIECMPVWYSQFQWIAIDSLFWLQKTCSILAMFSYCVQAGCFSMFITCTCKTSCCFGNCIVMRLLDGSTSYHAAQKQIHLMFLQSV